MTKTIHIHLPPGMVVTRTTRDSGDWKESDHPRAKNGQFGSGGGGGSAPAAKEKGRQTSGTEGKQSLGKAELMKHPAANKADYDYLHRENGMSHEEIKARWDREHAKKNPPPASSAKPVKHATGTGQSFLPKQGSVQAGSVTKTGSGFTAKNPNGFKEFFKPDEEHKAKAWAEGKSHKEIAALGSAKPQAPASSAKPDARPGWEKNEQGNQVPAVGAKVKVVNGPENATVKKVVGNVATLAYTLKSGGKDYPRLEEFHVTKLYPVAGGSPAKPQAPASSSGAPNWSASNGNWDKAKKEGRELVQAKLQEAKSGGDRTDALLALKKQAEVEHKKGSYLAAVVVGEVNDYFSRLK